MFRFDSTLSDYLLGFVQKIHLKTTSKSLRIQGNTPNSKKFDLQQ